MNSTKYTYKYNDFYLECTFLTYRMLIRSGQKDKVLVVKEKECLINEECKEMRLEEVNQVKKRLIKEWFNLTCEEIIHDLDILIKVKVTDIEPNDLKRDPEIQLLRTFATEKGIFSDINDIIKLYSQKECFGKFQHALCFNNLGVLHTRKQICAQSLEEFYEVINSLRELHKSSKAPFYNLILLFNHLLKNEMIFDEHYLETLSKLLNKLNPDLKSNSWNANNIKKAYLDFAKFADNNIVEPKYLEPESKFIFNQYKYIIPDFEVLNSFGNLTNEIDYVAAENEYSSGQTARNRGNFQASIDFFKRAKQYNPGLIDADFKISQVMHEWREKINQDNNKLHEENKFDECNKNLKYLPNIDLKREYDDKLINTYLTDKIDALTKRADTLFDKGRELLKDGETEWSYKNITEAKIIYFYLLNQKDLNPCTRLYVSNKLREIIQNHEG